MIKTNKKILIGIIIIIGMVVFILNRNYYFGISFSPKYYQQPTSSVTCSDGTVVSDVSQCPLAPVQSYETFKEVFTSDITIGRTLGNANSIELQIRTPRPSKCGSEVKIISSVITDTASIDKLHYVLAGRGDWVKLLLNYYPACEFITQTGPPLTNIKSLPCFVNYDEPQPELLITVLPDTTFDKFSLAPLEKISTVKLPSELCVDRYPLWLFAEINDADLGGVSGYIYTS